MTQPVWEFPISLPRYAFSVRDAARAGDMWRCCQEVAVEGSTLAGWSPMRYRREKSAFVVYGMVLVHHREATYGERPTARTWVSNFKRGVLSTRQVRIFTADGPIASATQQWVHVDAEIKPKRAPAELLAAFPLHVDGGDMRLPSWTPMPGSERTFEFECWYTWMDPLDHANHPVYVDWCDESLARTMVEGGIAPVSLVPVADSVRFRAAVSAGERVRVASSRIGMTESGAVVFEHRIAKQGGVLCAEAITIRNLEGRGADSLAALFD